MPSPFDGLKVRFPAASVPRPAIDRNPCSWTVGLVFLVVPRQSRFIAKAHRPTFGRRNTISELESAVNQVQVEQKTYEMPPKDGITVAHFITVADIERSLRFYETVFDSPVLSRGDNKGARITSRSRTRGSSSIPVAVRHRTNQL